MSLASNIKTELLQEITTQQAWHYQIIPFQKEGSTLHCLTNIGTTNIGKEEELELLLGKTVILKGVDTPLIEQALGKYYRKTNTQSTQPISTVNTNQDFLNQLINEAKNLGSSDIHLEPYEEQCRIRFRVDGVLMEKYRLKKEAYPSIVNKIKIKANLDIAEKRLPQDGRIFFEQHGQKFDIRVSTLPTLHGEKVVMRLLSDTNTNIDIEALGFQKEELEDYLESVYRPNGMVLISGPTGSGKTTTLYATLQVLNQTSRNILTIEDPIEYTLEGINQVQLKESIGLDFASAMRTFLRQDPDIIMVGEVRDLDTASMAIRASLTGHLVLTTIHTNWSWGIVARLIDMGVPGYLLADTLNAAVAQRLLRLLCPHCKTEQPLQTKSFPRNYKPPFPLQKHFVATGCQHCHFAGYRGRKAVYEIIPIDEELAEKIKIEELNVKNLLKQKGIKSLSDNAFELLANGLTSIEEVYPILTSNAF